MDLVDRVAGYEYLANDLPAVLLDGKVDARSHEFFAVCGIVPETDQEVAMGLIAFCQ